MLYGNDQACLPALGAAVGEPAFRQLTQENEQPSCPHHSVCISFWNL